jgi:hypothetical protein
MDIRSLPKEIEGEQKEIITKSKEIGRLQLEMEGELKEILPSEQKPKYFE